MSESASELLLCILISWNIMNVLFSCYYSTLGRLISLFLRVGQMTIRNTYTCAVQKRRLWQIFLAEPGSNYSILTCKMNTHDCAPAIYVKSDRHTVATDILHFVIFTIWGGAIYSNFLELLSQLALDCRLSSFFCCDSVATVAIIGPMNFNFNLI